MIIYEDITEKYDLLPPTHLYHLSFQSNPKQHHGQLSKHSNNELIEISYIQTIIDGDLFIFKSYFMFMHPSGRICIDFFI